MAEEFKRMRQMVGTTADWSLDDIVIGDGEIVFERNGTQIKAKLGDGSQTFSQLPYYVDNTLWAKTGIYTHLIAIDGPVVIGATTGPHRFTIRGGDYTQGIYREIIPTDGQELGKLFLGANEASETPVPGVFIRPEAVGDWTPTNNGALLRFGTCAENEVTVTGRFYIADDGGLVIGNPTGGSQGPGTINAQALYINGVALVP